MFSPDLSLLQSLTDNYTELRVQENTSVRISLLDGNIVTNDVASQSGIFARVFSGGYWGCAAIPRKDRESITETVRLAEKNACFLRDMQKQKSLIVPQSSVKVEKDLSTTKKLFSERERIELLKEIDAYLKDSYPQGISRFLALVHFTMDKHILTSMGTDAHTVIPRTFLYFSLTTEHGGIPFELYEEMGGCGSLEDIIEKPEDAYSTIDTLIDNLEKKKHGVKCKGGMKDVILDADLAGILAHEAIGHTTEADLVLNGSVAADNLGKKVASSLISLTDYAHTRDGALCPVPVFCDDEGTAPRDAVIIDRGVLKGFMHSKETAALFDVEPTGNARAFAYSDEPIVRMRNTVIEPGNDTIDDMIASIEDGYYFSHPSNGQADSTSEFMFGVDFGYEIKNGKLANPIKSVTISGTAFDMLKTVSMVSCDMKWKSSGMCGKKQLMPVGMGGPAIKCKLLVGGE